MTELDLFKTGHLSAAQYAWRFTNRRIGSPKNSVAALFLKGKKNLLRLQQDFPPNRSGGECRRGWCERLQTRSDSGGSYSSAANEGSN